VGLSQCYALALRCRPRPPDRCRSRVGCVELLPRPHNGLFFLNGVVLPKLVGLTITKLNEEQTAIVGLPNTGDRPEQAQGAPLVLISNHPNDVTPGRHGRPLRLWGSHEVPLAFVTPDTCE